MSSIAAGTTTTTGYVVSSDTTGALVLKTGASATTAVTIDTSQNVGIGTGSPATPLDVVANSSALNLRLRGRSADSIGQMEFWNNAGSTRYGYISSESTAITLATTGALPLIFATNGTEKMRLDSSGNLGLGVTPSPWYTLSTVFQSNSYAFEGRSGTPDYSAYWTNAYLNAAGSAFLYRGNGFATVYLQSTGTHRWRTAPSGTAGNGVTFTEVMTLDSSGNLGIGTTSPVGYGLHIAKATAVTAGARIANSVATWDVDVTSGGDFEIFTGASKAIVLGTSGAERARLTSGGNFGIGTSSPQYRLSLGNTVGRKLAIYDDGSSGGVAAGFGTDLSGSGYELSAWSGSPGGGNGIFTWGQVNTTNGAFAERMRINTNGDLLVGTASFSSGGIQKTIAVSGDSSAGFQLARNAAVAAYIYTYGSAGYRVETTSSYARVEFVPGGSGGVQLASAGATSWTSLSDERTKTDLVPITDATQKVLSLRAVTGRFIKDDPETSRSFLIAQDFVDVFPQAVTPYNEKDNETEYLGLAYTDTIPLLVAAIKEQQAIIQQLQADVAALKGTA